MPPAPEQFDASLDWLEGKLNDGTFDCIFGYLEGGGFAVADVDSHSVALELMADYPLFGLATWEVRPLLDFREGTETVERNWSRPKQQWAAANAGSNPAPAVQRTLGYPRVLVRFRGPFQEMAVAVIPRLGLEQIVELIRVLGARR